MGEQRIVNRAADDAEGCRGFDSCKILFAIKTDSREALADVAEEKKRLVAADSVPTGAAG